MASCTKNSNENLSSIKNPKLVKSERAGCFVNQYRDDTLHSIYQDTMYYSVVNDTLFLNITMLENCNAQFTDSVTINNDTVNIWVTYRCTPIASCICNFDFNYYFTNYGDEVKFVVYENATCDPEYTVWGTLTYP